MDKIVLKEFKKEHLWIKLILYGLFTLVGFKLLHFSNIGFTNPIKYVPMLFYTFAYLSLLTYFVNRVKGNYELLHFGLINIIVGSFVLVNVYYPNSGFILSDAVLLYSILNVLNSGYTCIKEIREKNMAFFMKAAITLLLLFLGVFVVVELYDKVEFGTLILGYYFALFGLLYLLEVFSNLLINNKRIQKSVMDFIEADEKLEKKVLEPKEPTKRFVKDRTIKKIKRK